jgi:hypothetical protein
MAMPHADTLPAALISANSGPALRKILDGFSPANPLAWEWRLELGLVLARELPQFEFPRPGSSAASDSEATGTEENGHEP